MRQRAMIGVVFVIGISIGAYFGSVQLAASTPNTGPRVVTLRVGDVAVFGRIRCAATTDARPPSSWKRGLYYMRCSKRPLSLARYSTDIFRDAVSVWEVGTNKQLYATPR
jgi:hypothetical protein